MELQLAALLVVLIEPSRAQCKIVKQQFEELGIKHYKHFETGGAALESIFDKVPDLVISTNTLGKKLHGLIWLDGNEIYTATTDDFQPISGAHHAKYDKVELIDLDKDGDLDVLICEENFGPSSEGLGVVWYENKLGEE